MRIRLPKLRRCWWCHRIRMVRYTCMVGAIEVWHWVCGACTDRRPDLFEDGS